MDCATGAAEPSARKEKDERGENHAVAQTKPSSLSSRAGRGLVLAGCSRQPTDTYQGYVEGKFVYVGSPQAGRLTHLSVARGESIAVNHPLFNLDQDPEAAAERQAAQLLRASQARLADLRTGKRPAEIDVVRAQLMQAQASKQKSIEILNSYQSQYAAGGLALTDLIEARAAVETNTGLVRQFESELAVDALPAATSS